MENIVHHLQVVNEAEILENKTDGGDSEIPSGLVAGLAIAFIAIFAADVLEALLGPGSTEFAIYWLPYAGFLSLAMAVLYIPAILAKFMRQTRAKNRNPRQNTAKLETSSP